MAPCAGESPWSSPPSAGPTCTCAIPGGQHPQDPPMLQPGVGRAVTDIRPELTCCAFEGVSRFPGYGQDARLPQFLPALASEERRPYATWRWTVNG